MEKFIIESRFEIWTNSGKSWSDWFVIDSDGISEKDAKNKIKSIKKTFEDIDKKTKLKHEYRLSNYNEYLKAQKNLGKTVENLQKHQEKYYQSKEYKELCKKKRVSAKERKEKQKQYEEEHLIN